MSYFQINANKFNKELIDINNVNKGIIFNFLTKVSTINPHEIPDIIYMKFYDKEHLANEIIKLIKEDLISIKEELNLDEFSFQYFFNTYNPIIKMSSFSCELKNKNDGAIIYDISKIGKYKGAFYLILPEDG